MSAEKPGPAGRTPGDWTTGQPAITYGRCPGCAHVWYFRRERCPRCGGCDVLTLAASGAGRVAAVTTIRRAPGALRALAPYTIVLVDAVEGFRLMAHGPGELTIGTPVQARVAAFGDRLVPYVEAVPRSSIVEVRHR